MKDYQQRVVEEQQDLDALIKKLDLFISGSLFQELDNAEQNRLKLQTEAMQEYSDILDERIEAFDDAR